MPREPAATGAVVPVESLGWAAGVFIPREEFIGPFRDMVLKDTYVTLAVLALTFLIASIVARQMTTPIEHLSQSAQRLGGGEFAARARVTGTVELAALANTINLMAESIQQRDEELRKAFEREKRIATVLQRRMLPDVPPRIGRAEFATGYFPAREEAELGGDFYDVVLMSEGLVGLLIADVSGKGLSAAVHTAMAKYILEGFASEDPSPALVLSRVNRVLVTRSGEDEQEAFVTAFFAVLDTNSGRLVYANAGHPPPIWRQSSGAVLLLAETPGPPLGVVAGSDYEEHEVSLSEGDVLLLYTDGVIEARRSDEWFDTEGLVTAIAASGIAPEELVRSVYESVGAFVGGRLQDDVGLLAVRLGPAEESVAH